MRWILRYWPIVPLLILAIWARNWVEDRPNPVVVEETINMRETQSDYYLEEFTTRKFDATGTLQYRVSGKSLLHFPEDDRSEITEPNVILLRDGVRWDITSATGEMLRKPDTFTLFGNVEIERAGSNNDTVSIRTESLSVHADNNEVSTDQPIEVIANGWRMRSIGLQSNIDDGKLIFLSEVTGHYDVAKPETK